MQASNIEIQQDEIIRLIQIVSGKLASGNSWFHQKVHQMELPLHLYLKSSKKLNAIFAFWLIS